MKKNISLITAIVAPILAIIALVFMTEFDDNKISSDLQTEDAEDSDKDIRTEKSGGKQNLMDNPLLQYAMAYDKIMAKLDGENSSKDSKSEKAEESKPVELETEMPDDGSEVINGIRVRWNNATPIQQAAIGQLLNDMVTVEGGTFMMGSDDSEADTDEGPAHPETVGTFKIDKYEISQFIWETVMGNNPSAFKGSNLPVENITWIQANNFLNRINGMTGLHFRLPTEAEWEYAARGGNQSQGYNYSGSPEASAVSWDETNSAGRSHEIGSKLPNELGLYNMSGNVAEWTSDHYSNNYSSPRNSDAYVFRGGAWHYKPIMSRVSRRRYSQPGNSYNFIGLRPVLGQ